MNCFIVEDSRTIRQLLVRRVEELPGATVVGESASEAQALALIAWTGPDLVLLDLHLAEGGLGMNVLRELRRRGFAGRIFVMSHQGLDAYRQLCVAAGADRFYDKGGDFDLLLDDLAALIDTPRASEAGAATGRLQALLESADEEGAELAVCVIHGLERLPPALGAPADVLELAPQQLCLVVSADAAGAVVRSLQAGPRAARVGVALYPAEAIAARSLLSLAGARAAGLGSVA